MHYYQTNGVYEGASVHLSSSSSLLSLRRIIDIHFFIITKIVSLYCSRLRHKK